MEGASEEVDFSKLGLEERINHKNWKARVSGYEDLAKQLPLLEDKEFQKYSGLMKKIVIDSNAAAQEKGLAAVLAYVDYCPVAGKYVDGIVTGIATKCLTATRIKTKDLSNDIVLMCVEIEKQDVVLEELIKGLDQKTPKNVAACVGMIRKCLLSFGYKVINIKLLIPSLPKLLERPEPAVRDEAKQLAIEIYRWIKDALMPQLSSLKPILLQELTTEFEKVKSEKATPERLLRSQQAVSAGDSGATEGIEAASADAEDSTDAADEEIDPFELMTAVDILAKLPADFHTLLESKKWQERKDALEKLQQLLEANPKLVTNADYSDVIKKLKHAISKDANIVVATLAIKCLGMLASGLRKGFQAYANGCVSILLDKFKEKKANVVQTLRECIDVVYQATNLEAIETDLTSALDNKNPSIRSETALFLARCFAKTNPATISKKLLKTLVTSLLKTLNDSDPTVRESSAESLGTASKAQGDRNMLPLLQGLEAIKMAKIEEYKAKAEIKKFAAPPPEAAVAKKPVSAKRPVARPPAKAISAAESQESLTDFGSSQPTKAPVAKSAKFGQVKSRLGIPRGPSSAGTNPEGFKYGTTVRRAAPGTATSNRPTPPAKVASSGSPKKAEDLAASQAMMNSNLKSKEQRIADEKALKVLKWNFTTPREEFYLLLKEQMIAAEWNALLITYLFHSDFKFHIKAIGMIQDFLIKSSDDANMVVANIDLILKWIALRFFDTNPSVILKELELLLVIFRSCESIGYALNDMEANSFLPYLVLKLGDAKDTVRNKVHDILHVMRNIYAPNKLFAHLFTGLQSKNSRQRATCLEEIASLIELKGMSIFQMPNSIAAVKDIAKLLVERDNSVRNGALSCIVQVYFIEGEKVFKLVGNLSDKEMSLVEERIKRASKQRPMPPVAAAPPIQENESTPIVSKGSGLPLPSKLGGMVNGSGSEAGGTGRSMASRLSIASVSSIPSSAGSENSNNVPSRSSISSNSSSSSTLPLPTLVGGQEWQSNLQAILNSPMPKLQPRRSLTATSTTTPLSSNNRTSPSNGATNAMTQIFASLSSTDLSTALQALDNLILTLHPEYYESNRAHIENRVDQLVILCNKQYRIFLNQHYPAALATGEVEEVANAEKLLRCTSKVINRVFSLPLGKLVSRDTLRELLTHLLPFIHEFKNNETIFQTTNFITQAVLKSADSTNLISALVRMLHDYVGHDSDLEKNKFLELTMKFLWRIAKTIKSHMDTLNVDVILLEAHIFFSSYPRNWWKTSAKNDLPLRTLKTLIFLIVQQRGDAILDNFSLIEKVNESELSYYVQKSLRHYRGNGDDSSNVSQQSNGQALLSTPASVASPMFINGNARAQAEGEASIRTPLMPKATNVLPMANGKPEIRNEEDLKRYVLCNAEAMSVSLNWDDLKSHAVPLTSLEEASRAVDEARQRLETIKLRCRAGDNLN